jgi:hypothetical protein
VEPVAWATDGESRCSEKVRPPTDVRAEFTASVLRTWLANRPIVDAVRGSPLPNENASSYWHSPGVDQCAAPLTAFSHAQ